MEPYNITLKIATGLNPLQLKSTLLQGLQPCRWLPDQGDHSLKDLKQLTALYTIYSGL